MGDGRSTSARHASNCPDAIRGRRMRRKREIPQSEAQSVASMAPLDDTLLTLGEVSEWLRMGRSTIYRQMTSGILPKPIKLSGGGIRWQRRVINNWLSQQRGYQPPAA
ncbi:helix-turn-helix transcriptional regulator [Kozakia baliensis]|uniref:helix-turn-helix transcriptional regulator n=1 Tax=Kozakia baliensis TaxID=153496 RepID=UPI0009DE52E4